MGTHEQHLLSHGYQPKFGDLWNPEIMVILAVVFVLYIMMTGRWRDRFTDSTPVPIGKKVTFLFAILTLYAAIGSPIYFYSHVSFTVHMFQQSLFLMIFPPLVLMGIPDWFLRAILKPPAINKWFRIVTKPMLSLLMFNLFFSVYHIPMVLDFVMQYHALHLGYKLLLLGTAFMLWWHMACPIVEYQRIKNVTLMGFIFAAGVLMTPACALIIFASEIVYDSFRNAPQLFIMLPILDDQQLGGVIMKMIQEIAYGVGLWYAFRKWYQDENPAVDEIDPIDQPVVHARAELGVSPQN
ncbi:cytochrome c oxidase assembly protein [Brevibacillus daliensis]|uniref:cytochrome c oxidase assembly protein n=1 Tax=Brevibacillus daliensis TaxID=2892995 RepID=UPI001E532845|nr:cytochrome c oxidase assembly protein [Brevibacillus daliensis]